MTGCELQRSGLPPQPSERSGTNTCQHRIATRLPLSLCRVVCGLLPARTLMGDGLPALDALKPHFISLQASDTDEVRELRAKLEQTTHDLQVSATRQPREPRGCLSQD